VTVALPRVGNGQVCKGEGWDGIPSRPRKKGMVERDYS
jgi:hypothetical protein